MNLSDLLSMYKYEFNQIKKQAIRIEMISRDGLVDQIANP